MAEGGIREAVEIVIVGVILFVVSPLSFPEARGQGQLAFSHSASTIYLDDDTGSRWPVLSVARTWDSRTDVRFRFGNCRADAPCIRLTQARLGGEASASPRYATVGQSTSRDHTRTTVRLNDRVATTPSQRRSIVCRELGRALGLPLSADPRSCMAGGKPRASRPTVSDVAEVNSRYS